MYLGPSNLDHKIAALAFGPLNLDRGTITLPITRTMSLRLGDRTWLRNSRQRFVFALTSAARITHGSLWTR